MTIMKQRISHITGVAAVCLLFLCLGCATTERPSGVYHRVQQGETLSEIARIYNTNPEHIAAANDIEDIHRIERDRVLFIPRGGPVVTETRAVTSGTTPAPAGRPALHRTVREETLQPAAAPEPAPRGEASREQPVSVKKPESTATEKTTVPAGGPLRFVWPMEGSVTSRFGPQQGGTRMNGITIESATRAPVTAVEAGTVLHSAPIKFYGETIILRHRNNYLTIYSQLESRRVQTGDQVSRGDTIGMSGRGETSGNHRLYFEMRRANRPVDPLSQLPGR